MAIPIIPTKLLSEKIQSFELVERGRTMIEGDNGEMFPGIIRDCKLRVTTTQDLIAAMHDNQPINVEFQGWKFKAYIANIQSNFPVDGVTNYFVDLTVTGPITGPLNKDSRMSKKEKALRFYVGSPKALSQNSHHVGGVWAKETLAEAVKHAQELCEKDGQEHFVVQIVRRVRRKVQPIVVETVRG